MASTAAGATEVDISFAGDASATTVTITHRGWERLGTDAPAWCQRNLGGWSGLLPVFRQAAAAPAVSGAPGRVGQPEKLRRRLSTAPTPG